MKKNTPFVFLLNLLFLSACEFAPEGSHFEELNPNPEINAIIDLEGSGDTIPVRGNILFNLSISIPERSIYGYEVYLGEKLIKEEQGTPSSIVVPSTSYENGYYPLKILILANSGTGSLGDKTGAEILQVHRTWVLDIENGRPSAIKFKRVFESEGRLKVEWEKYKKGGFQRYVLYKDSYSESTEVFSTTDQAVTSWIDSTYIGGNETYKIAVQVDGLRSPEELITFSSPLPEFVAHEITDGNNLLLKFTKTTFYNNFRKYKIEGYPDDHNSLSIEIPNLQDTIVLIQGIGFGRPIRFLLKTIPQKEIYNRFHYLEKKYLYVSTGEHFGDFSFDQYIPSTNTFYGVRPGNEESILFAADGNSLRIMQERSLEKGSWGTPLSKAMAPNGQWLYVAYNATMQQLDPQTLETIQTFSLTDIFPTRDSRIVNLSVSNNNRLAVSTTVSHYQDSVFLIDMNKKELLIKAPTPVYPEAATISPDGKLFAFSIGWSAQYFIENEIGEWEKKAFDNFSFTAYSPTEPLFAAVKDRKILLFGTETAGLIREIETAVPLRSLQFDPESGFLGGLGEDAYYYIYHPGTASLLKKVKLAEFGGGLRLFKNKLFSNGYYLPLVH